MDRYRKAIDNYGRALESASPETLEHLLALCEVEIEFRDPFNHTHTLQGFRRVLEHMFKTVHGLKFEIHEVIGADKLWVLKWTFTGKLKLIGHVK